MLTVKKMSAMRLELKPLDVALAINDYLTKKSKEEPEVKEFLNKYGYPHPDKIQFQTKYTPSGGSTELDKVIIHYGDSLVWPQS
jgi:hypothetical protein